MKNLIFSFVIFLSVLSFYPEKVSSETGNNFECDYWTEIVHVDGIYYLNEYCGDKLILSTPIEHED